MAHNPQRNKQLVRHRQRKAAVNAGVKHSDILRRRKIGRTAPVANQINTNHGFRKEVFSCKNFTQTFECIYAGNNTGFGVNFTGDRSIKVERGTVYINTATVDKATNEQTNKNVQKVGEGAFINLPRGTGYSLATAGSIDVELLITETTGYDKKWVLLDESSLVMRIDEAAVEVAPISARTPREGRDASKSAEYMAKKKLAATKNRKVRMGQQPNPESRGEARKTTTVFAASVPGVNPPLLNPESFDD